MIYVYMYTILVHAWLIIRYSIQTLTKHAPVEMYFPSMSFWQQKSVKTNNEAANETDGKLIAICMHAWVHPVLFVLE